MTGQDPRLSAHIASILGPQDPCAARRADAAQVVWDADSALDRAREGVADAERVLRDAVQAALAEGVRAATLADGLGVTRARVYQIRDGRR